MAPLWTEPIKNIASHNNHFFNRLPEKNQEWPLVVAMRSLSDSAGPKKNRAGAKKTISKSSKLY